MPLYYALYNHAAIIAAPVIARVLILPLYSRDASV